MKYGKSKRGPYKRSDMAQFYFNAHPACEACGFPSQDLHHIITRKTGGEEEDFNYLALCKVCHMVWHNIGRVSFATRYPHLMPKIKEACEKQGRRF